MKLASKWGVARTAKVITASRHRSSRVRAIQPGNREWVTVKESRKALSSENIHSGFNAASLIPLNPQRVLKKLTIKNITPPATSHGPTSDEWISKTPYTTAEVQKQIQYIKQLIRRHSESPPNEALRRLAKATESTMHEVILCDTR
jgi:hypothetical protein